MEHEATLRFVTNLDRSGIENHIHMVAQKAGERQLNDVAALLAGAPGKSRAELDAIIDQCLALLKQTDGNRGLCDQLEMVQINLPNLG